MTFAELFRTAKPNLRGVKNYQPGKPIEEVEREYGVRGAVKMASNENALGPSPKAVAAMKKALHRVHQYPDGGCYYLRHKLAKRLAVKPGDIVFGNGSDELLVLAARAFVGAGEEVVIADPTFLIYEIAASVEDAKVVKVPMKTFRYDLAGMLEHVTSRTKLVFIANPDNPVGTYVTSAELRAFLDAVPRDVIVVLDEAYQEFAAERRDYPDGLRLRKRHPNLVVTRTFSKAYGLAGLRIGYAVCAAPIANALNKVREPFNVNGLAQVAAIAALDDKKHLRRTLDLVRKGRAYLYKELRALGLPLVETATNFILFDARVDALRVSESLMKKGVIVRPMTGSGLRTFLRVTIGKPGDNRRFVDALKKALREISQSK